MKIIFFIYIFFGGISAYCDDKERARKPVRYLNHRSGELKDGYSSIPIFVHNLNDVDAPTYRFNSKGKIKDGDETYRETLSHDQPFEIIREFETRNENKWYQILYYNDLLQPRVGFIEADKVRKYATKRPVFDQSKAVAIEKISSKDKAFEGEYGFFKEEYIKDYNNLLFRDPFNKGWEKQHVTGDLRNLEIEIVKYFPGSPWVKIFTKDKFFYLPSYVFSDKVIALMKKNKLGQNNNIKLEEGKTYKLKEDTVVEVKGSKIEKTLSSYTNGFPYYVNVTGSDDWTNHVYLTDKFGNRISDELHLPLRSLNAFNVELYKDYLMDEKKGLQEVSDNIKVSDNQKVLEGPGENQCEIPEEKSQYVSKKSSGSFMDICTGLEDDPATKPGNSSSPADTLLSQSFFARSIKNNKSDYVCKVMTKKGMWSSVSKAAGKSSSSKITIQDYIKYRCVVNDTDCSRVNKDAVKRNYNRTKKEGFPSADELFEKFKDAKFSDSNGNTQTIPPEMIFASMYNESKGDIFVLAGDGGRGLFQITDDYTVPVIRDGVVISNSGSRKFEKSKSSSKNSVYHPESNFLKFIGLVSSKWKKLEHEMKGIFTTLPLKEKWEYVFASFNGGEANLIKPHQRLNHFNKYVSCNSCESLKTKSCKSLTMSCKTPIPNKCGDTIPKNYDFLNNPVSVDVLERFHSFIGIDSSNNNGYNFINNCIVPKASKGPCNIGVTYTYIRKMRATRSCFM